MTQAERFASYTEEDKAWLRSDPYHLGQFGSMCWMVEGQWYQECYYTYEMRYDSIEQLAEEWLETFTYHNIMEFAEEIEFCLVEKGEYW